MRNAKPLLLALACLCVAAGTAPGTSGWVYLPFLARPDVAWPACPLGVSILSTYTQYIDTYAYLHLVGEVCNQTPNTVSYAKVIANFADAEGHLVDTTYTYLALDTLAPGARGCFHLSLRPAANWAWYWFEAVDYNQADEAPPALAVYETSGGPRAYGGYRIIGLVRNDDWRTVRYVEAAATLYDANLRVIGCGSTYANTTELAPGQVTAFDVRVSGRDYSDLALFRVKASGSPQ
jgi:hypothetical protein